MKSTGKQKQDLEKSSTYALTEDKQKSNLNELLSIEDSTDGIFTILSYTENDRRYHSVMLGKYRLSEKFETIEEAREDALRTDWERKIQVMGVIIEEYKK